MVLKVSSDLFARRLGKTLYALKGVAMIADDNLCVGCGDSNEEATVDLDHDLSLLLSRDVTKQRGNQARRNYRFRKTALNAWV
jgi:hypothetical protein